MPDRKWNRILAEIAKRNHTTVEEVRREMNLAMKEGQHCPDPAVRAQWERIPKKNGELTTEDLLDYLLEQILRGE